MSRWSATALIGLWWLLASSLAWGQGGQAIVFPNVATLPATCRALQGVTIKTGTASGMYLCNATGNGWIGPFNWQVGSGTSNGQIPIWDNTAGAFVAGDPLVQGLTAHDAAGATTNPVATGGFAYAAAPTAVSTDGDIVRAWHLLNGAGVFNLVTAGTLYDARQIRALSSGTDSVAVTGTFWQATQPVSGTFWQATQPVSGTFWQATQPVSGTVTANIGTSGSLALDASVTGLHVAQASTTSGQTGGLTQGAVTTAAPSYTTAKTNPLSLNTAGGLRVDGSGVTQPVSGTFWQATQPVSGTFWQATQPVSGTVTVTDGAGALNVIVDSGSVTANAGTNLNTSALALDTSVTGLSLAQSAATSGQKAVLIQGAVTTGPPSYTTGNSSPLSLGTSGSLRIDLMQAGGVSLLTDFSAFTEGVPKLLPSGLIYDEVAGGTVSENTINIARMDIKRAQVSVIEDETTRGRRATVTAGNALKVDASATTQPVSAASLPLPTGASTEASLAKLPVAQGSTTSGLSGPLMQAAATTAPPGYTTATTNPLSMTTGGSLRTDLSTVAGSTASVNNGTVGTGVQRVVIASDNSAVSGMGVGATAAAPPANANFVAGLGSGATGGLLTGVTVCDSFAAINISTATTTLIATGVSGRHVHICAMVLITAAANNVAMISGTGATCGTGTAGMSGGTTAASGWNFAANGGLAMGQGFGDINRTVAAGDSVCLVTSAATQLSGRVTYAIY